MDVLAELFVYAFAAVYVILFGILAQSWIRGAFGGKAKKRGRRAAGSSSPGA
jgi:hypothetical protein